MKKVITYGTYDLLHYGHIRLLERAKALGDYLIVGVTSDDFDRARGKINVSESLTERINGIIGTGLADAIIVEEYEGQKIDDIKKYGVDVFVIGSDWEGQFDYLRDYCEVVYLPRTEGVSSTELRMQKSHVRLGLLGNSTNVDKVKREAAFVNGVQVTATCDEEDEEGYEKMLSEVDAVYIYARPDRHKEVVGKALGAGRHVLVETPVALNKADFEALQAMAEEKHLVLMEALKTAFSIAFQRLVLLVKSGAIGEVVSVDATCTSIEDIGLLSEEALSKKWGSLADWGPTGVLPVFELLGNDYRDLRVVTQLACPGAAYDTFTKLDFVYDKATASVKVGKGVKSEGELVISGTKGYIYVPAPWWKTDYFEVRFEDPEKNKRYFYQLEGEGIRNELLSFVRAVDTGGTYKKIGNAVTEGIVKVMEASKNDKAVIYIG